MHICVLFASPHPQGNTASLLQIVLDSLKKNGVTTDYHSLYTQNISPCLGCRACQNDWSSFSCCQHDDMNKIAQSLIRADLVLLATPIYSWYCTPPAKAVLDRMVYGFNKFYGTSVGPALLENKNFALITTCGYRPEKGADLLEEGIKRYCKHSHMHYLGMLCERHLGYNEPFLDEKKILHAQDFASTLHDH